MSNKIKFTLDNEYGEVLHEGGRTQRTPSKGDEVRFSDKGELFVVEKIVFNIYESYGVYCFRKILYGWRFLQRS